MGDWLSGPSTYSEQLGRVSAEVIYQEGAYFLFLVGDNLSCFIGSSFSLDDCKEEIKSIKELAQSDLFHQAIASVGQVLRNSG